MPSNIPRYVRIDGPDNLVRDTFSMGVINTNTTALDAAKRKQQDAFRKLSEETKLKQELNTLRNEVDKLNVLIGQLIEKSTCR